MATTKKNTKTKKILTEDAFNANGNATITEKVLNENIEKTDEKEDEDKSENVVIENIKDEVKEENENNMENLVIENVEDKTEKETINVTAKIEEDLSNVNVTGQLHINSNKKIINNGFSDESFYR